jgi:hypothetical protein
LSTENSHQNNTIVFLMVLLTFLAVLKLHFLAEVA